MDSLSFLESFYISNTFEKRFGISMEINITSIPILSLRGREGRSGKADGEGGMYVFVERTARGGWEQTWNCSYISRNVKTPCDNF